MSFLGFGQPIHSPVVPFILGFPTPLPDYGLFSVDGFVPMDSYGFAVNFQTGPSVNPRDDVGLHLGFSFTNMTTELTLNTIRGNNWETPVKLISCPVRKMDPFQMMILVQRKSFMVAFNNQHFCEFHHRMDPITLRYIAMDGQVIVNRIQLEFPGGFQPPAQQPAFPPAYSEYNQNHNQGYPISMLGPSAVHNTYSPMPNAGYSTTQAPYPQNKSAGLIGMIPAGATAATALGGLAALAAPLFYPGKQKKMSKSGWKQQKFLSGMGFPAMGGMGGMGGLGGMGGGGGGPVGGSRGMMGPALGAGLGAAALGYGLGRMKHGRRHGHGHGGWDHGGYGRRSSSSSSSSSSSDSD